MAYSGFWRRFLALVIDACILIIPAIIVNAAGLQIIGGVLVGLLYKPVFEASPLMGTPGKALLGMVVLSEQGQRLSVKQAYIRYFCSWLSGFVLGIGYFMNLFTAKRQTLHDMIAEAVVVDQTAPELNYFQVWLDEVKFLFNRLAGNSEPISNAATSMATPPKPPSNSANTSEVTKAIEDLHKLYQAGALSQEEFETKKQELLKKI